MKLVFKIPFLSFNNSDKKFGIKKLTWGSYTTVKVLLIVKSVKLIDRCEIVEVALDRNINNFVFDVAAIETPKSAMLTYFS